MLCRLRELRKEIPSQTLGGRALDVLNEFRTEFGPELREALSGTITVNDEVNELLSGALTVQKLKWTMEMYARFVEDSSDILHNYLEPIISDFSKDLGLGDCFVDAFNSRHTVNTSLAQFNDKLRHELQEIDQLGYSIDSLRVEIENLTAQIEASEISRLQTDLSDLQQVRRSEQEHISDLKTQLTLTRALSTAPGVSLEDFQMRNSQLRKERDSLREEIGNLKVSLASIRRTMN